MSNKSNDIGRAFEYACIVELKKRISEYRPAVIKKDTTEASARAWNYVIASTQNDLTKAANAYDNKDFFVLPLALRIVPAPNIAVKKVKEYIRK